MFSRIMERLDQRRNVSETDIISLENPDFSMKDFPCSTFVQLEKLNTLCATKPTVKSVLVS